MKWMRSVADVFMPRVCAVCGRRLNVNESFLCLHCLADMPLTCFWGRTRNPMADRFNGLISDSGDDRGERYAYACPLFFFEAESPYRNILYEIKYKGHIALGTYMGRMLGANMASADAFRDIDAVIPVPLHWMRRWKRGYNQAETIASGIASELGVALRTDILRRTRRTRTQTRLDIAAKAENVRNAFKARTPADPEQLKHILLVDDMFTTGATAYECFKALRRIFPPSVRISVATLGFVSG